MIIKDGICLAEQIPFKIFSQLSPTRMILPRTFKKLFILFMLNVVRLQHQDVRLKLENVTRFWHINHGEFTGIIISYTRSSLLVNCGDIRSCPPALLIMVPYVWRLLTMSKINNCALGFQTIQFQRKTVASEFIQNKFIFCLPQRSE